MPFLLETLLDKDVKMSIFEEEPRRRKPIGKKEWETQKKIFKNKCIICGKTEKSVGILQKAHIKAHSRGGSQVVPMCPTCHYRYDNQKLTATQLRKIGLTKEQYKRLAPKKKRRETSPFSW